MGFGEDKMPAAPGTPESLTGESGNLPGVAMTSQSMPVLSKPSVSKLVRESVSGTSDFGRVSFSKVSRTMRKVDGIREECGIPAGETFLEDYLCAVQRRVLKQGRMFVFERHVTFHSNLFGHHKYYSIPIKDITRVSKECNVGFPNSLRIKWGHQEIFFTSFLNRADAYKLIMHLWRQQSSEAPELSSSSGSDDEALGGLKKPVKRILTKVGISRNSVSSPQGGSTQSSRSGDRLQKDSLTKSTTSMYDDDDDDFENLSDEDILKSTDLSFADARGDPPSVSKSAHVSLEYDLPCSTQQFWKIFLANDSDFFMDFHRSRGDTNVKLTKWQKHSTVGMVRDMQFVTAVKSKMGPDKTLCVQTQRFVVYSGQRLLFQTSQTMNDIPYSDHFTVDSRWDVTPASASACKVQIFVEVPFSKKTMWKTFIEKGVREGCINSYTAWRDMAKRWLAGDRASPPPVAKKTSSPEPEQQAAKATRTAEPDSEGAELSGLTPRLGALPVPGWALGLAAVLLAQAVIFWLSRRGLGAPSAPLVHGGAADLTAALHELASELRELRLQMAAGRLHAT